MISPRQESIETSSIESIRHEYQNILSLTIQPYTIQTFYDDAINQLVVVNEKLVALYKKENPGDMQEGAPLEDAAAAYFQVTPVNQVLDTISLRRCDMVDLESRIQQKLDLSPEVFVPPDADEKYRVVPGSGKGFEEKKLIPRLMTLVYILEHDLGLHIGKDDDVGEYSQVLLVRGEVADNMMRVTPYYRVSVGPYNCTIYICDEKENASFVFYTDRIQEVFSSIEDLDRTSKKEYKDMIEARPGIGMVVRYGANWRERMLAAMTSGFEISTEIELLKRNIVRPQSDFESKQQVPNKKEGWKSGNSLASVCKVSEKSIRKFTDQFKEDYPDWFEIQRVAGNISKHYHPDLVAKIIEHFTDVPQKREGWESASSLSVLKSADYESIKNYAVTFRKQHPDWFEDQKTGPRTAEHYHPDLVAKIIEHFTEAPQKKEGWESASSLSALVKADPESIKNYAETFYGQHLDWFENQKAHAVKAWHYHPDLVAKIIEHFTEAPQKKEGWESAASLMKKCKASLYTIKSFAKTFHEAHPQWLERQRNRTHRAMYYHPDLVAKIIEHFTNQKK